MAKTSFMFDLYMGCFGYDSMIMTMVLTKLKTREWSYFGEFYQNYNQSPIALNVNITQNTQLVAVTQKFAWYDSIATNYFRNRSAWD